MNLGKVYLVLKMSGIRRIFFFISISLCLFLVRDKNLVTCAYIYPSVSFLCAFLQIMCSMFMPDGDGLGGRDYAAD